MPGRRSRTQPARGAVRRGLAALGVLVGFAVLATPAPSLAAPDCPLGDDRAPGKGGMTPRPVVFWAGTVVADPDLLDRIPGKAETLTAVREAMLRDKRGLPALFEHVGAKWLNYVGDFGGLQDTLGTHPMRDTSRRYLGAMVSIDRLVRFKPDVVEMATGVGAASHVQWLFGSINLFDARGMHIAFSFPFVIRETATGGSDALSAPGALLRERIAATAEPMGDGDSTLVQRLSCQLRGAVLRHLGLSRDMKVSGSGGVDAAVFMNGIQGFRVNDKWFTAKGDMALTAATRRRVKALVTYMTRVKVARQRPVAPLANASRELVQRQGKDAIRAVYDHDVEEAGQMCGMWGERVSWNEQGDRVVCFELPEFARNLLMGARIATRIETTQGDYKRLRIDSVLDLMMKEGPRKAIGHVPASYSARVGEVADTEITDVHVATALINNVADIDVTDLEKQ